MLRIANRASYSEPPREKEPVERGFVRTVLHEREIPVVWNEFRLRGSSATLLFLLGLGTVWKWPGGYILAAIAAVSVADAYLRRIGRRGPSLLGSVALDMTLIGAGIFVADLEPAAVATPYLYMMAVPLLLLPLRQALVLMGYATGWVVLAHSSVATRLAPPLSVDRSVVTLIAFIIFAGLLLSLIGVVAMSLDRSRRATQQRLQGERALTTAGQKLLAESGESALAEALEAIRESMGADAAFVAENRGDATTGPAALVRQISASPDSASDSTFNRWTLPYMQHQEVAAALALGEVVRLDEALSAVMGEPAGVVALGLPVFIGGEWSGFLGIAHRTENGNAPEPDLHVLETVATMLGAFFERQTAHERLEQLIRSKDQFLASVSHEIRTPLTSVLGFASLLKEDPEQVKTTEGREIIELIEHQALEVSDLIEDLLVAARAEIDAISIVRMPLRLGDEINNVISSRLGDEQSDIFVASSPSHRALADPTRVRQIIRNLLTNALRYGGDQITVTTHRDGPEVLVVFSDNGEGIPPELRRRIFDPYERGVSAMTKPESIGLGLSVSRQLARLMDGDLTLRTDLSGATFQLTLPLAPKDSDLSDEELPEGAVVLGNEVHITVSASEWGIEE